MNAATHCLNKDYVARNAANQQPSQGVVVSANNTHQAITIVTVTFITKHRSATGFETAKTNVMAFGSSISLAG